MPIDSHLVAGALAPITLPVDELSALVAALQQPPCAAIRVRGGTSAGPLPFSTEPVPWHPDGRLVVDGVRPGALLEYAAGDYYIQDAASLLAIALLAAQPGEFLCDLCAAPGGKATAILEALAHRGWLVANEAVQSRYGVLEFNLARHGLPQYVGTALDPDKLADRLPGQFDGVLVDAPCSGQSLIGRGKQSHSAFAPATIEHCAARQTRILEAAARLVRPGGRLVYSTCTFAYAENEGQVESFLRRHSEWILEPPPSQLARWASARGIGLRLWPHLDRCGGAYAASLRRSADASAAAAVVRNREPFLHATTLPAEFREWGELRNVTVRQNRLQCFAWPEDISAEWLAHAVTGPEAAFRKANTWFPAYALAMRRDPDWTPRQRVELDDDAARRYVQGEVLSGAARGWSVATWRGRALGWLKGDGRQWKNHLPKAGRMAAAGTYDGHPCPSK